MHFISRQLFLLVLFIWPASSAGQFINSSKFTHKLDSLAAEGKFSGSVLVAMNTSVVFEHFAGFEDRKREKRINENTLFELASLSKQFTAALILKLVEEEKLKLEDHFGKYLPWYPGTYKSKVTIHQLLSHQSGIPNYTQLPGWPETSAKAFEMKHFVELFSDQPLEFEPGTSFSYSNSNYYLLGLIAEEATGEPFEALLDKYIWQPLSMKNSGTKKNPPVRLAIGYERLPNGFIERAPSQHYSTAFSVSGMYSTPRDLLKWSQALTGNQFISEEFKTRMFTPNKKGYGYGFVISDAIPEELSELLTHPFSQNQRDQHQIQSLEIIWHWGSNPGYNTLFLIVPRIKATIIILENLTQLGADKATLIYDLAEDILTEILINQPKEE